MLVPGLSRLSPGSLMWDLGSCIFYNIISKKKLMGPIVKKKSILQWQPSTHICVYYCLEQNLHKIVPALTLCKYTDIFHSISFKVQNAG